MNSIDYPFTEIAGKIRPFIPIMILNPFNGKQHIFNALLDSGADACAFPKYVVDSTGHNLKAVDVINSVSTGIGGVPVTTWKHSFLIGLVHPSGKGVIKWSSKLLIDCFDHDNAPPLLGTNDFLKDFKVILDYPNKIITLIWS
ncbi:hypothetical protein [Flavobacterium sp. 140616W15]|uniref:hypothetical protein n=1 Tax=Flavobacterium sp. 140616W15 TaxID=2478552 RepID=UPI000F0BF3E9|nr:hypothetical protein [Flavobacterium sp. 140616W15]AYN04777.1 hypothetical protein EAG11_11845 [Flavobacterium sp. 140616W15]